MKANEVMIGDWVISCSGKPFKIGIIDPDFLYWNEVQPIPLTPEILEKNGFVLESYSGGVMSGKWWTRNDFVIHESMNDSVGRNNFKYEYVHQLQRALRLCGIEKEIVL